MSLRMLRFLTCVSFAAVLLLVSAAPAAWSQAVDDADKNHEAVKEAKLALSHVTLYSSGMGWFVYEGPVDSKSHYMWKIRESEVSDVLRTLNVTDSAGGWSVQVEAGQDPIRRSPTMPNTQTRGDLLMSMKGEPIRIRTRLQAVMEGRVVAIELRPEIKGELVVERELLSILTDNGLETVALDDVAELSPQRESFRGLLSESLDQQRPENDEPLRTLQVYFGASEQRTVAVAMLRPTPMWKSTYRVYDDTFLHRGIVENTTNEDWRDISLALVDGNPVTFRVDLDRIARAQRQQVARPAARPEVPAPFSASLRRAARELPAGQGGALGGMGGMGGMGMGGMGGMGGGMGGFGMPGQQSDVALGEPAANDQAGRGMPQAAPPSAAADRRFAIQHSASGVRAEAGKAGEAMQIVFDQVTVPAGQAVVLDAKPFDVGSKLLSVYRATSDDRMPLLSLELQNDTTMRLPAGPLSVFLADTGYAGDAMLPLLSPDVKRLVGFAVDDGVRVSPQSVQTEHELVKVAVDLSRRSIGVTRKETKKEAFVIDNRSGSERQVLIEHEGPETGFAWSEASPEGEQTEDGWRFSLHVEHDQQQTLQLVTERTARATESFVSVDLSQIQQWLEQDELLDEENRKVLAEVMDQRREQSEALKQLSRRQDRRKELLSEIERVTRQLTGREVPLAAPLADRYQNRLLELEDEREEIDGEITELKRTTEELNEKLQPPSSGLEAKTSTSENASQILNDPFGAARNPTQFPKKP